VLASSWTILLDQGEHRPNVRAHALSKRSGPYSRQASDGAIPHKRAHYASACIRRHAILSVVTRTRFDQFGKQMVRTAVAPRGPVETDAEVPADTRRIDLWFMGATTSAPVPDHLGLLGRITAGPSTLEFFHNPPSGDELAGCLIKHGEFRHFYRCASRPRRSRPSG